MRVVGVLAFAVVLGVTLSAGCSVFNDCESGDPPICETSTKYSRCIGGEGQYHRMSDDCPAETTCDASRAFADDPPCFGKAAGGTCSSDSSCDVGLRCANGVCAGPPAEAVAACTNAQVVTLSNGGESLDFDLTLSADVAPFESALGPSCSNLGRVALLHIATAPSATHPIGSIMLVPLDAKYASSIRAVVGLECDKLYAPRTYSYPVCATASLQELQYVYAEERLVVALAPDVDVASLKVRLLTR